MPESALVIGAGIVGLATARALAVRGVQVTVLERNDRCVGASIRNFGMVWPIGQPDGPLYQRAMLSRSIWMQICREARIWFENKGSLHLAYSDLERKVLEEFNAVSSERNTRLLTPIQTFDYSSAVVQKGLRCSLFSSDELIVDPRQAIHQVTAFLQEKYQVQFFWSTSITEVRYPKVRCGSKQFSADRIFICNGADFENLYAELFSSLSITKCKLQMLRLQASPKFHLGPPLCGALSLIHYSSFLAAPSLPLLKKHFETIIPQYLKWGIHVMICQHENGELTVGDSHEYGAGFDPFNRTFINQMILDYLKSFCAIPLIKIGSLWNGIYAKTTNGATEVVVSPEPGVTIINGLGGAGMTLSFGLCEQLIDAG